MNKEMIERQEALIELSKKERELIKSELDLYKKLGFNSVRKISADYEIELHDDYLKIVFDSRVNELEQQLVGADSKIEQMEVALEGNKSELERLEQENE